jgi:uncharacterized membrane protein (DUF441 family)
METVIFFRSLAACFCFDEGHVALRSGVLVRCLSAWGDQLLACEARVCAQLLLGDEFVCGLRIVAEDLYLEGNKVVC